MASIKVVCHFKCIKSNLALLSQCVKMKFQWKLIKNYSFKQWGFEKPIIFHNLTIWQSFGKKGPAFWLLLNRVAKVKAVWFALFLPGLAYDLGCDINDSKILYVPLAIQWHHHYSDHPWLTACQTSMLPTQPMVDDHWCNELCMYSPNSTVPGIGGCRSIRNPLLHDLNIGQWPFPSTHNV